MAVKALILAGGFGTRLRSVVSDVPKSLATIDGVPFLKYLLNFLSAGNVVEEVVLAIGYKGEMIIDAVGYDYKGLKISYSVEDTPLGTGGAIRNALNGRILEADHFMIFNGDTFARLDLKDFLAFHKSQHADITIASLRMKEFDRYGSLSLDSSNRIIKFNEKKYLTEGFISCGVYLISKKFFEEQLQNFPVNAFSIEKDVFEKVTSTAVLRAFVSDHYFIDIGIPEDYERAQQDFKSFNS
jgi:D-glycero-alpha-D-manno-heptose 1-phosphate guanylyltransferase